MTNAGQAGGVPPSVGRELKRLTGRLGSHYKIRPVRVDSIAARQRAGNGRVLRLSLQ